MDHFSGLDRASSVPVFRQLSDWIVEQVSTGAWLEGHQLPAEPALAASLGVSRGTLRKTIAVLVQRGILEQVHGKGTFVARSVIDQPLASSLSSVSEEFIRSGTAFSTVVLTQELVPAGVREARAMGLAEGAPVVHLLRVRSVDGNSLVLSESFVPADGFIGLIDHDFRVERLFEVMEADFGAVLTRAHRTISAITASKDVAKALDAQIGSPILYSEQSVFDADDRLVEYSRGWFRGDRFRLSSETIRHEGDPVHAMTLPSAWTNDAAEVAR